MNGSGVLVVSGRRELAKEAIDEAAVVVKGSFVTEAFVGSEVFVD